MTLLTYQVFKTVTEQGSFRKAADLLGLTPSAVSHAVSSLEAELGFCVLNLSLIHICAKVSGSIFSNTMKN